MSLDLALLDIQKVIVHLVPRGGTKRPPDLSEIDSPLDDDLRLYIKEKISRSAGSSYAFNIEFDPATTSPVPDLVRTYLSHPSRQLVSVSQQLANHLHQVQTGVNPDGLLTVVDCKLSESPAIAILKLEWEAGVRLKKARLNGKNTLSMQHLRELMLTKGTRVFKAGVFVQDGAQIKAVASDLQRGDITKYEIAKFFISRFLGCRLIEDPAVATKRFFEASEAFINSSVTDPERKARYQIALLAFLKSNEALIRPAAFAANFLDEEHRAAYMAFLGGRGVSDQAIPKSLSLIKTRLDGLQMSFASGTTLFAPPSAIEEKKVRIRRTDQGKTQVLIEDDLQTVRGRRKK